MACELGILNTNLPLALINEAYSWQIPFDLSPMYMGTTGTLPTGITLNTSTLTLSGVPTISGVFGFSLDLVANGCVGPTVTVPFTLTVLAVAKTLSIDMDPLPLCMQKGINYSLPIHITGGVGPYALSLPTTITFDPGFNPPTAIKPEYTAIEQTTSDDAILHFNIANAGTYYVEIDVEDRLANSTKTIIALAIADFCADKPTGVLGTSHKSPAIMVKESWHQTNMINFLPEVLRK